MGVIQQCDIVVTIKIDYKKLLLRTHLVKNWFTLACNYPVISTMKNINTSFQIWKSMATILEMEYTKKLHCLLE
jgi:hypothetical protein